MTNFKNIAESIFKECNVDVFYTDRSIGNTLQSKFRISCRNLVELEIIETSAPDLVIEKLTGKCYNFACALAIQLADHYGDIQLSWIGKPKESNNDVFELAVYYSKTNVIDETTKNQMMFYHSQQNLDLHYMTTTDLEEAAKFFSHF